MARNSGNLNCYIAFQKRNNGKDAFGANSLSPEIVLQCWAELKTQGFKDYVSSHGTALEDSVTFVIREQLRSQIDSTMRIKHNNTIYDIIRINPDVVDRQWCYIMAVAKS